MKITVNNLVNANGNATPNQFVKTIWNEESNVEAIIFQSYKSDVCKIDVKAQTIVFGNDWDYSITTMKHLKKFLNDYPITTGLYDVKELRKREDEGVTKWRDDWMIFFIDITFQNYNKSPLGNYIATVCGYDADEIVNEIKNAL